MIRECDERDIPAMERIINAAAERYRGVIPADRWHDPYMPREELEAEIRAGVRFSGYEEYGKLAGVMGLQVVRDATLIRHAYVLPGLQGRGIGGALMHALLPRSRPPLLVGTWAAATWAIRFYQGLGFRLVDEAEKNRLLDTYWTIPGRQRETSVVLAYAG